MLGECIHLGEQATLDAHGDNLGPTTDLWTSRLGPRSRLPMPHLLAPWFRVFPADLCQSKAWSYSAVASANSPVFICS